MKKILPVAVFLAVVLTGWDGLAALAINFGGAFENTAFGERVLAIVDEIGELPVPVKTFVCQTRYPGQAQYRSCMNSTQHRFQHLLAESKKFYGVPPSVIPVAYAEEEINDDPVTVTSARLLRGYQEPSDHL